MNARRRKFASEYVQNGYNGVQAAISSGYTQNYFAAGVTAHRLLKDAKILEMIDEQNSGVLSDEEILKEISKVAKANVEIKGSDKMKGLEMLAKNRGLIKERVETSTSDSDLKSILAEQISMVAEEDDISLAEAEFRMQARFVDKSRKSYNPDFDPSVNPHQWPSGNLITKIEDRTESKAS